MSTTYPTSKQTFTDHVDNDSSDLIDAADVNDVHDTVEALEDLVGITDSTTATSHDYLIKKSSQGWADADETWTYASATTFTISGDQTGKYSAGMRIKLTQTTVKYFVITAVSYGAPNTTVTVNGGGTYTLANAAISANYYSSANTPLSFPHFMTPQYTNWADWTSNPSGWTGTVTTIARYCQIGKLVTCIIQFVGTSNQTYATFALPVASNQTCSIPIARAFDAGTGVNTSPWMQLTAASTTVTCYSSGAGAIWTNSGAKYIYAVFSYEVA